MTPPRLISTMTSKSAGSQSKEKDFLGSYIEPLLEERVPENTDENFVSPSGQVRNDLTAKFERGVLRI